LKDVLVVNSSFSTGLAALDQAKFDSVIHENVALTNVQLSNYFVTMANGIISVRMTSGDNRIVFRSPGSAGGTGIELYAPTGKATFIDFHPNGDNTDFALRLIANVTSAGSKELQIASESDIFRTFSLNLEGTWILVIANGVL
jgi:hypothetical protein